MMDDETFFAWLDGELDPAAAAQVAATVAADPVLQRRAEAHRALTAGLKQAFAPIADAPVKVTLPAGDVIDLEAARRRRVARAPMPSLTQWAAIAATLVIGFGAGMQIDRNSAPVRRDSGTLVASADLGRALDRRLASAPAATGPRIGLTFRDQAGAICRSFTDGGAQGLACHDGDGWRIRGLFQGAASPGGEFRMAAGSDPALAALIDGSMAGEPFDAARERQAQANGWR